MITAALQVVKYTHRQTSGELWVRPDLSSTLSLLPSSSMSQGKSWGWHAWTVLSPLSEDIFHIRVEQKWQQKLHVPLEIKQTSCDLPNPGIKGIYSRKIYILPDPALSSETIWNKEKHIFFSFHNNYLHLHYSSHCANLWGYHEEKGRHHPFESFVYTCYLLYTRSQWGEICIADDSIVQMKNTEAKSQETGAKAGMESRVIVR